VDEAVGSSSSGMNGSVMRSMTATGRVKSSVSRALSRIVSASADVGVDVATVPVVPVSTRGACTRTIGSLST
jgi:hypothetical protein